MVYPALLPPMRTPWLPVVDWTDAPADLNGHVRFAERRILVSARVPSHFKSSILKLSRREAGITSQCSGYVKDWTVDQFPAGWWDFSISEVTTPTVEPIHPPIQCVLRSSFRRRKVTIAWSWPFTPVCCWIDELVEQNLHALMCLNGANKDNFNSNFNVYF